MVQGKSPIYILFYAFLITFLVVTLMPFYIMLTGAFKTQAEINSDPLSLPGQVEISPNITMAYIVDQTPINIGDFMATFGLERRPASHRKLHEIAQSPQQLEEMQSYIGNTVRTASVKLVLKRGNLIQALLMTLFVVLGSVAILSVAGGMAAYPLALARYGVFNYILVAFTVGLSLPLMLGMVPLYIAFSRVGLLDQPIGVMLIYSGVRMPMTILIFYAFYCSVPRELEDASKMDGLSRFGFFFRILLPTSKAAVLTTFVISGTYVFNDYMTPLIFMTHPIWTTVQVALARFVGAQTWFFGPIFAGVLLASLPMLLIYLLMNRTFITGVLAGSVK
jgi:raffinose/stachyose/melibiose transport system permease protein